MPSLSLQTRDDKNTAAKATKQPDHLGDPLVQFDGGGTRQEGVVEAAGEGVSGGGGRIPYFETIQESFGSYDVSGISAHTGAAAEQANAEIGSNAYAMGSDIAFSGSPSLHTAAHEAAHTMQQANGVQLEGGVGQPGDVYEQHADDVADAVVRGESAEPILDQMPGGGKSVQMKAVQMDDDDGPTLERQDAFYDVNDLVEMDDDSGIQRDNIDKTEIAGGVADAAGQAGTAVNVIKTGINLESTTTDTAESAETATDAIGTGASELRSSGSFLSGMGKIAKALTFPPISLLVPVAMLVSSIISTRTQVNNRKALANNLKSETDKGDDQDPNLVQGLGYGLKKTWTKLLKLIWSMVKYGLKILGAILLMFAGPVGAAIKVGVELFTGVVSLAKALYEKGRGVWKWLKGNRGKQRQRSAQEIFDSAVSGDAASLETVRVFVSGGLVDTVSSKVGISSEAEATDLTDMSDDDLVDWLVENESVAVQRIKTKLKSV